MKLLKNRKSLMGASVILLLLSGCTRVVDSSGKVLPEKIISASTTLSDIWSNESWFSALFVFPLAKMINYLAPILGIAAAIADDKKVFILCSIT